MIFGFGSILTQQLQDSNADFNTGFPRKHEGKKQLLEVC